MPGHLSGYCCTDRALLFAAFRSGAVMGFLLSSLGLLVLFITIKIFGLVLLSAWLCPTNPSMQHQHVDHPCWSCCTVP